MKKIFVLFLSLTVLTACSKDDDSGESGPDPIIGTWVLVDASFVSPEACEQESTINFKQDNTVTGSFYLGEAQCAVQGSAGNWQNLGNSVYSVSIPVAGDVQGTVTFSSTNKFVFTTPSFGSFTFEKKQ